MFKSELNDARLLIESTLDIVLIVLFSWMYRTIQHIWKSYASKDLTFHCLNEFRANQNGVVDFLVIIERMIYRVKEKRS